MAYENYIDMHGIEYTDAWNSIHRCNVLCGQNILISHFPEMIRGDRSHRS